MIGFNGIGVINVDDVDLQDIFSEISFDSGKISITYKEAIRFLHGSSEFKRKKKERVKFSDLFAVRKEDSTRYFPLGLSVIMGPPSSGKSVVGRYLLAESGLQCTRFDKRELNSWTELMDSMLGSNLVYTPITEDVGVDYHDEIVNEDSDNGTQGESTDINGESLSRTNEKGDVEKELPSGRIAYLRLGEDNDEIFPDVGSFSFQHALDNLLADGVISDRNYIEDLIRIAQFIKNDYFRSPLLNEEVFSRIKKVLLDPMIDIIVIDSLRFLTYEREGMALKGGIQSSIFPRLTELSNIFSTFGKTGIALLGTDTYDDAINESYFERLQGSVPLVMRPHVNDDISVVEYSFREGDRARKTASFEPNFVLSRNNSALKSRSNGTSDLNTFYSRQTRLRGGSRVSSNNRVKLMLNLFNRKKGGIDDPIDKIVHNVISNSQRTEVPLEIKKNKKGKEI